jgi:hypothetical protein
MVMVFLSLLSFGGRLLTRWITTLVLDLLNFIFIRLEPFSEAIFALLLGSTDI